MSNNDRRDHVDAGAPVESLIDILRKRERNLSLSTAVASPATLVTYNPATQRGNIQLAFRAVELSDPEVTQPPVVIPDVFVVLGVQTSTSYDKPPTSSMAGATGLAVFCDRALDVWFQQGGSVDPGDARAHSLADAIFFPMVVPNQSVQASPQPAGRVIEAPAIYLGAGATQFVALANLVLAELNAIKSAFDSHTHTVTDPISGPLTSTPPLVPMPAPGNPAATKTRAE